MGFPTVPFGELTAEAAAILGPWQDEKGSSWHVRRGRATGPPSMRRAHTNLEPGRYHSAQASSPSATGVTFTSEHLPYCVTGVTPLPTLPTHRASWSLLSLSHLVRVSDPPAQHLNPSIAFAVRGHSIDSILGVNHPLHSRHGAANPSKTQPYPERKILNLLWPSQKPAVQRVGIGSRGSISPQVRAHHELKKFL
jgi:hypothetical protein